jgi:hypothetical protein
MVAIQVKIRRFLYIPGRHIGGVEAYLHSFLTLILDGGAVTGFEPQIVQHIN